MVDDFKKICFWEKQNKKSTNCLTNLIYKNSIGNSWIETKKYYTKYVNVKK